MDKVWHTTFVALVLTGAVLTAGQAPTPAAQAQEKVLQAQVPVVAKACGVTMAVSIDWNSFQQGGVTPTAQVGTACSEGFKGLARGCAADAGDRLLFQNQFKSFVCAYGGPGKRRGQKANGTMTYFLDFATKSHSDYVEGYMFSTLKH